MGTRAREPHLLLHLAAVTCMVCVELDMWIAVTVPKSSLRGDSGAKGLRSSSRWLRMTLRSRSPLALSACSRRRIATLAEQRLSVSRVHRERSAGTASPGSDCLAGVGMESGSRSE